MFVPMDSMSDGEIDFRLNSTLMVLRNACMDRRTPMDAGTQCGVYYFNWRNNHFDLIRKVLVGLTKLNPAP